MQKIFLNYDQQIEKLKNEKNLLIDNEAYAKEILKQTSYYSLIGGYKDIFKNPTTKKYKDGTRFEDIVELYYFDELLRQLFLRYLIKVENGIKSQVSYYFTEKNGENQKEYLDTSNYNYSGKKNQRDIDRLIKILEGYVTKPTDYHYINHSQTGNFFIGPVFEFKFCRIPFIGFIRSVTNVGPDSCYLSGKSK